MIYFYKSRYRSQALLVSYFFSFIVIVNKNFMVCISAYVIRSRCVKSPTPAGPARRRPSGRCATPGKAGTATGRADAVPRPISRLVYKHL